MPLSWTYQAYLAITLSVITSTTTGTPELAFPINSQVPPVAYVEQPYEFTFSRTTFTNDGSELLYVLANSPAWLSIDSSSRKLSGTPTSQDTGAASFQLIASDKTSQTTSDVVLVTLQQSNISVRADILFQLEKAGSVSAPATLLLHPLQYFSFDVPVDTFQGTSSLTTYYAVSADGSPLPSWLQFNAQALQFSGTTPPLLAPTPTGQAYSFSLAASNVVGFSEAEIHFQILVGSHLLAFTNPQQNISIDRGSHVNISTLLLQLTLDGNKVSRNDLSSVASSAPDWLVLNDADMTFNGIVPEDAQSGAFVVSVSSNNSNNANVTVLLQVVGTQTASQVDLGSFNATTGSFFSHVLERPASASTGSSVTADLGGMSSWIEFSSQNLTLYGVVPDSLAPHTLGATITFNDTISRVVGLLTINIVIPLSAASSNTTSVIYPSQSATSTAATTSTPSALPTTRSSSTHRHHILEIVLATVLPVLFLLLIIAFLLWFLSRKRRKTPTTAAISETGDSSGVSRDGLVLANETILSLNTISRPETAKAPSSARPPRIELLWAPDSMKDTRKRLSKKQRAERSSIIGPSWDDLIRLPTPTLEPVPSPAKPQQLDQQIHAPAQRQSATTGAVDNELYPRTSHERSNQRQTQRTSVVLNSIPGPDVGLPKRMSGAGHGSGLVDVAHNPPYRSSWQTTFGTIPKASSRPITMLQEPVLPLQARDDDGDTGSVNKVSMFDDTKPTVRLVNTSSDSPNDFEAARQRFYTDRARDQLEGSPRFTNTIQNRTPSRNKLDTEVHQPSLQPLAENANATFNGYTPQSWSHWSAIGPAVPTANRTSTAVHPVRSIASSRQFDSAISSDSQWEDDDLVADENAAGERYWQTNAATLHAAASARLPFEQHGTKSEDESTADRRTRLNLADQRKRVSVEDTELQRTERSHRGSFRFI